jgi:hypothetical protein
MHFWAGFESKDEMGNSINAAFKETWRESERSHDLPSQMLVDFRTKILNRSQDLSQVFLWHNVRIRTGFLALVARSQEGWFSENMSRELKDISERLPNYTVNWFWMMRTRAAFCSERRNCRRASDRAQKSNLRNPWWILSRTDPSVHVARIQIVWSALVDFSWFSSADGTILLLWFSMHFNSLLTWNRIGILLAFCSRTMQSKVVH